MASELSEQMPEPAQRRRIGLLWSVLLTALVLALFSSGYVGYRVYLQLTADPLDELRERVTSQLGEHGDRLGELNRTLSELQEHTASAQLATEDELATLRERLEETARMVVEAAPPSEREWKLAELEYLLRIANHRLNMEHDVKGALQLLLAADEVLESMDDFGLLEVRAALAHEISALKMVPGLDVSGIYVRIEALSESIAKLEPRAPWEQEPGTEAAHAEDASGEQRSVWAMLSERLQRFVRIRVSDALPRRPQLSEDELRYLRQALRLQLEQAKLGLLRRDQTLYGANLASSATWLREYFDPESVATVAVLDELEALARVQLEVERPDISGSLNLLRGLRRLEEG